MVNATPRSLYPRERTGIHRIGGWVGPRAGLDGCGKSRPPPGFLPQTVYSVVSRYTDWAIPAPTMNKKSRKSTKRKFLRLSDKHRGYKLQNGAGCRRHTSNDSRSLVSIKREDENDTPRGRRNSFCNDSIRQPVKQPANYVGLVFSYVLKIRYVTSHLNSYKVNHVNTYLTNYMEKSPAWEANRYVIRKSKR